MSTQLHAEPDSELLRAHLAGDQTAFEALYARYRVPTYAYLMRRCGGALAENSFRATWRAAATSDAVDLDHEFVAQLFGIAHAEVERVAPEASVTPESTLPELTHRTRHRAQRFERSLRQVPPPSRDAYLLYEEGGLTLAEVGDILGVDAEVARERVRRALSELRSGLDAPALDPTSLHDPAVAVAHLAGRRTPSPSLDAVVLDEARRAAEANAERARSEQGRFRLWPYLLLIGVALALAQAIVFWTSPEETLPAIEPPPVPASAAISPEDLPVADPVVAPKTTTVRLMPKSTQRGVPNEGSPVRAAPRPKATAAPKRTPASQPPTIATSRAPSVTPMPESNSAQVTIAAPLDATPAASTAPAPSTAPVVTPPSVDEVPPPPR